VHHSEKFRLSGEGMLSGRPENKLPKDGSFYSRIPPYSIGTLNERMLKPAGALEFESSRTTSGHS